MAMEKGNPLEKQQQQQEKGGKSDSQLWCSLRKRVWMIGLGSILRNLGHFLPHKLSGFFLKLLLPRPWWPSLCSSEENKFQEIGAGGLLVTGIEIVSIQLFAVLVVQTFPCHSQSSAFYLICRRGKKDKGATFHISMDMGWRRESDWKRQDTTGVERGYWKQAIQAKGDWGNKSSFESPEILGWC